MIEVLEWVAAPLISGAVIALVLWSLFLAQERVKLRRKRVQYANLIFVELNNIRDIVKPLPWSRSAIRTDYFVDGIPKNVYDGLVASAMISIFSIDLQRQLHEFYKNVAAKRPGHLRSSIDDLLEDIHRFNRLNARLRDFFKKTNL